MEKDRRIDKEETFQICVPDDNHKLTISFSTRRKNRETKSQKRSWDAPAIPWLFDWMTECIMDPDPHSVYWPQNVSIVSRVDQSLQWVRIKKRKRRNCLASIEIVQNSPKSFPLLSGTITAVSILFNFLLMIPHRPISFSTISLYKTTKQTTRSTIQNGVYFINSADFKFSGYGEDIHDERLNSTTGKRKRCCLFFRWQTQNSWKKNCLV